MIYRKCLKREGSLTDVRTWYKGESSELENGIVTLYYENDERGNLSGFLMNYAKDFLN